MARAVGLGDEAAETAWDPNRISAPRSVCEGALGTGVHAATDHRHKRGGALRRCSEEVLYRGATLPGKIYALLAKR